MCGVPVYAFVCVRLRTALSFLPSSHFVLVPSLPLWTDWTWHVCAQLGPFTLPTPSETWLPSRDRTLRRAPPRMTGPDPEDAMRYGRNLRRLLLLVSAAVLMAADLGGDDASASDDEEDEDPVALQAMKQIAPDESQVLAAFPRPSPAPAEVKVEAPAAAGKAKK